MAWPKKRRETALVLVDFMNVFLSRREAFQGPCADVRTILESCLRVGLDLALDPLVIVYLDLETFANRNQDIFLDFMEACEELDLYIFDVASDLRGRDQVDPAIIEDMLMVDEGTEPDVPFVLVSADKGFGPAVIHVRQRREVYIILPVIGMVSGLARVGDAWRWLHPVGEVAMVMADLIRDYDRLGRSSGYMRARLQLVYILSRLKPGKAVKNWRHLAPRQLDRNPRNWLTNEDLFLYTEALVYYGVLVRENDRLLVQDHPLVGRRDQVIADNSKPAFQR